MISNLISLNIRETVKEKKFGFYETFGTSKHSLIKDK